MMNREMRRANGIRDLPRPASLAPGIQPVEDPRMRRVKLISMPIANVAALLQMDGSYAVRMEGWPEGAQLMGASISPDGNLLLMLHHPDFPVVLTRPPLIEIKGHRTPMPEVKDAPDAD